MKNIILKTAFIILVLLVSCAKERTCNCDFTHSDTGNEYTIKTTYDPVTYKPIYEQVIEPYQDSYKTKESNTYDKVLKRDSKLMCPKRGVETFDYDYTKVSTKNDFLQGRKGTEKTEKNCSID